jgi:hypothetical protein
VEGEGEGGRYRIRVRMNGRLVEGRDPATTKVDEPNETYQTEAKERRA